MVKGKAGSDTVRAESKRLAVKLGESAKIRAPQAEAVAEYVRKRRVLTQRIAQQRVVAGGSRTVGGGDRREGRRSEDRQIGNTFQEAYCEKRKNVIC